MRQGIELEKGLSVEKLRQQTEQAQIELQTQKLTLVTEGKMATDVLFYSPVPGTSAKSDDLADLRLVPKSDKKKADTGFQLFERLTGNAFSCGGIKGSEMEKIKKYTCLTLKQTI